uniref:Uncharacterized protein n=1 Tax=Pithovirus LCPAC404 TaxID=2506597 RepID=A0A481ZEA2_9VIRU|nr:MAG: hypothetical protein LCPAC404_01440 [Pithovirus LCPAC404]
MTDLFVRDTILKNGNLCTSHGKFGGKCRRHVAKHLCMNDECVEKIPITLEYCGKHRFKIICDSTVAKTKKKCPHEAIHGTKCGVHIAKHRCEKILHNGKNCIRKISITKTLCSKHKNPDVPIPVGSISDKITKLYEELVDKPLSSTEDDNEKKKKEQMLKTCKQCRQPKATSNFAPSKRCKDGFNLLCEHCIEINEVNEEDKDDLREKSCKSCGLEKTIGHFSKKSAGKFGKCAVCKKCRRKKDRERYKLPNQPKCCPICETTKGSDKFGINTSGGDENEINHFCTECRNQDKEELFEKNMIRCLYCLIPKSTDVFRKGKNQCLQCNIMKRFIYRSTFKGFATKLLNGIKKSDNYEEGDISNIDEIVEIYNNQNEKCNLCDHSLTHDYMPDDNDDKCIISSHYHNMSLDRINSEMSYAYSNVQLVCVICNRAKWLMKQDEYIQLCKDVNDKNDFEIEDDWKLSTEEYQHILSHIRLCLTRCRSDSHNPINITTCEIMNMFIKQRGKCAISGLKMTFSADREGPKIKQWHILHFSNMSVDRIDNTLEHSMNNIHLVLQKINLGRSDLTIENYIKMCQATAKHNNSSI